MKNRIKAGLCVLAILMLCAQMVFAAGSCVFSAVRNLAAGAQQDLSRELSWVCTSAANGTISSPTLTGDGASDSYSGMIYRATISPGTGGNQPSDNFNLKLYAGTDTTDDLLGGLGTTADNATIVVDTPTSSTNFFPRAVFNQSLTPAADSMGNATQVTLKVLLVR